MAAGKADGSHQVSCMESQPIVHSLDVVSPNTKTSIHGSWNSISYF